MIDTTVLDFEVTRGETFNPVLNLFNDAAQTQPFNLTGWSASLVIGPKAAPVFTLIAGNGLTLGAASGTIAVVLTATQTASVAIPPQQIATGLHWFLQLTDPSGGVSFPFAGTMTFEDP